MLTSTVLAWAVVLQLSAISAFLLGYSVLLYKKTYTPGSVVWFTVAAMLHVFLWFQYSGEANRQMFKQGVYDLWQGISIEHQAAVASIFVAIGYLFCVISGVVAVIIVMKTREELPSNNKPS